MGMNKFWIIGNLTRNPIPRTTSGGKLVASYIVAVDDVEYDGEGNKRETTSYFPVSTIGTQAENDFKYLRKGSLVSVEGRMKSWRDEANNRSGHHFNAQSVQYLGSARAGGAAAPCPVPPTSDHGGGAGDDWVREYEAAETAAHNPAATGRTAL